MLPESTIYRPLLPGLAELVIDSFSDQHANPYLSPPLWFCRWLSLLIYGSVAQYFAMKA